MPSIETNPAFVPLPVTIGPEPAGRTPAAKDSPSGNAGEPGMPQPPALPGSHHADPAGARARPPAGPTKYAAGDDSPVDANGNGQGQLPIRGKVFALRDGSGYAALGSDGHFYRVVGGRGHALMFSLTQGYVSASMVNVTGGPVSGIAATAQPEPAAQDSGTASLPGASKPKAPTAHLIGHQSGTATSPGVPASHAAIENGAHATANSHATRTLIAQDPDQAMNSQANLSPESALALLR